MFGISVHFWLIVNVVALFLPTVLVWPAPVPLIISTKPVPNTVSLQKFSDHVLVESSKVNVVAAVTWPV